jgi:hypothetical protein
MVIILIRRCVRPGREAEFLASYHAQKPPVSNPDFIDETLTKIADPATLPEPMRSLPIGCEDCITYLNIARWTSSAAFEAFIKPKTSHDENECSDRLRATFERV